MNSFIKYNYPAVLWTVFIILICGWPGDQIPNIELLNRISFDKIIHVAIYFVLMILCLRGLDKYFDHHHTDKIRRWSLAYGIFNGALLEILQTTVFVNRYGEWLDFVADTAGCLLGLWAFNYAERKKKEEYMPSCKAHTPWAIFLVLFLRFLMYCVAVFKGRKWRRPQPGFHEDPYYYTFKDLVYLAYKYYLRAPVIADMGSNRERYFAEQAFDFTKPVNFKETTSLTLSAAGDLMPYEWIQPQYCANLWDGIGDRFFDSDLVFANLETPVDLSRPASFVPEMMLGDLHFNSAEEQFFVFNGMGKYKGFDVFSVANNHSLDMGEEGLLNTLDFLEKKNIKACGAVRNPGDESFCLIEKKGIRMAFLSYTYSMNKFVNPPGKEYLCNHIELNVPGIDLSRITSEIKRANAMGADMIVIALHYGNAYQAYPSEHVIENTHRVFEECGADIILGGHPHNIQPMERYDFTCPHTGRKKQGFAIYSMADFVAYDIFSWCHLPVYLKLKISKDEDQDIAMVSGVEAVPVFASGTYKSAHKRDLRFLHAEEVYEKVRRGNIPSFMNRNQAKELKRLMAFYRKYFNAGN